MSGVYSVAAAGMLRWAGLSGALGVLMILTLAAAAQPLTIRQIQYTTNPDGSSLYDGQVVDCVGGIVVGKYRGYRPRLILQDPDCPDGWGGIQVKDWIYPFQMFEEAQLGDWIELTNVLVEEFRGTTLLQRQAVYNPGYRIVSHNNPLPPPIIVSVRDIPAPQHLIHPQYGEGWYVGDHGAEYLESMRLVVRDVRVQEMNLGQAADNYRLEGSGGQSCWAADYMNEDVGPWGYHPFVSPGRHFCAVAGVFEQYTRLGSGWDYYQLVTLRTPDLALCGDGNADGVVDGNDFPRLAECLTGPQCEGLAGGCAPPAWTPTPPGLPLQHCLMMDFDYDGDVDLSDLTDFQAAVGTL